ncbi:MAG: hypothetical protein AB1646_25345 [Thermodesulfobacteriota bacterium]
MRNTMLLIVLLLGMCSAIVNGSSGYPPGELFRDRMNLTGAVLIFGLI